jgi:hypothetical protein
LENQTAVIEEIAAASKQAGARAHALNVTNHHVGRYQWETRFVFRANDGVRLATATVKRRSKYLGAALEKTLLQTAREHTGNLKDEKVWVYREPIIEASVWPFSSTANH